MPATATNLSVDSIDRDLAELQHRRTEARQQGNTDYALVLSCEIDRLLLRRYKLTNGRRDER